MSDETLTRPFKNLWERRNALVSFGGFVVAMLTLLWAALGAWGNSERHSALNDKQISDHEARVLKVETEQRLQAEYLIRMDGKIDRIGDRLGLDLRRKPFGK